MAGFKITNEFISKLEASLLEDVSDANRRTWSQFIISNRVPLTELAHLVTAKHPVGMRFSWMVGDIADRDGKIVLPAVKKFYDLRNQVTFPNFERSLAKFLYLAGIPHEMEGEAIGQLFNWLSDPKMNVSTKTFALLALQAPVKKYPGLKNELKAIVNDQVQKTTVSFGKKARKILDGLN